LRLYLVAENVIKPGIAIGSKSVSKSISEPPIRSRSRFNQN